MIKEFNVLITGVGGQGSILMTELMGTAAINDGLNAKGSEMIGLAQRGGPVNSMLRLGSAPQGPIIPVGRGDIMVALEPAEALRVITYMSKSSFIVLNTQRVVPISALLGKSTYPSLEEIIEKLKKNSSRIISLDAVKLAEEVGSALSANIVMLGAAFGIPQFPIRTETMKAVIETRFTGEARLSNIRAFALGFEVCKQALK